MQPITNSLINSTRKAVKFLHRDFVELEMLQKNNARNEEFCKKSYSKLKELLENELQRYTESLFFPEDQFDIKHNHSDMVFLINPIDSPSNFARAIPFFALSITCLQRIQNILTPVSTVIYFAALNEIYYAEKGKGAWVEKNNAAASHQGARLRVSSNADLKNSLIINDGLIAPPTQNFVENSVRIFGSPCYAAILLASGRSDLIYLSALNFTLYYAFTLFIKEAGGLIIDDVDKFISSNQHIAKQLQNYKEDIDY